MHSSTQMPQLHILSRVDFRKRSPTNCWKIKMISLKRVLWGDISRNLSWYLAVESFQKFGVYEDGQKFASYLSLNSLQALTFFISLTSLQHSSKQCLQSVRINISSFLIVAF
jgi:hypothetical protein